MSASRPATRTAPPAPACFHCGLPLPAEVRDFVEYEGARRAVCCAACAAVAELIIANGLDDYYRERDALEAHG